MQTSDFKLSRLWDLGCNFVGFQFCWADMIFRVRFGFFSPLVHLIRPLLRSMMGHGFLNGTEISYTMALVCRCHPGLWMLRVSAGGICCLTSNTCKYQLTIDCLDASRILLSKIPLKIAYFNKQSMKTHIYICISSKRMVETLLQTRQGEKGKPSINSRIDMIFHP